jgi:hypothetical protein
MDPSLLELPFERLSQPSVHATTTIEQAIEMDFESINVHSIYRLHAKKAMRVEADGS